MATNRWVLAGVVSFGLILAAYGGCAASLNGTTVPLDNCTPDACTQEAIRQCGSGSSGTCDGNLCTLNCPGGCAAREVGRRAVM